MLITVKYLNGKAGLVEDSELDELIRSNKIKSFLRSEGWVIIGRDRLRHSAETYEGQNKRSRG
jgi:hypothetical protein